MAGGGEAMVCVAQIGAPHGVRGAFHLRCFTEAARERGRLWHALRRARPAAVRAADRRAHEGRRDRRRAGHDRPQRGRGAARPEPLRPARAPARHGRGRVLPRGPGRPRGARRRGPRARQGGGGAELRRRRHPGDRHRRRQQRAGAVHPCRRAGGRPRGAARSRWCCRDHALDRHRHHHLPRDVPGPAGRVPGRRAPCSATCGGWIRSTCAASPPTGTRPSTTRPSAAVPAW